MSKNKLISVLGLSLAVVGLASCGEQIDPKLYHLTLSSNITLSAEQKAGLKATYGYGQPSLVVVEGTRDEDEIAELKKAGASDADIEKAGKRQDDGSYYFFDQDPVYLEAPEIMGYRFEGYYYKGTTKVADRCKVMGPADNRMRSRWNMDNADTELEAHYEILKYTITYGVDVVDSGIGEGNPANNSEYNALTGGDVTLNNPVAPEGKTFKHWYINRIDSVTQQQSQEIITKLPRNFDEEIIHYGADGYGLTIFAEFEDAMVSPTVTVKEGETVLTTLDNCITIEASNNQGSIPLADSYVYGSYLNVDVSVADLQIVGYELEGIYIDDVKLPDIEVGRVCNVTGDIELTHDTEFVIKVQKIKCQISWAIYNHGTYTEDITGLFDVFTIKGETAWVGSTLADNGITLTNEGIEWYGDNAAKVLFGSTCTISVKAADGSEIVFKDTQDEVITSTEDNGVYSIEFTLDEIGEALGIFIGE